MSINEELSFTEYTLTEDTTDFIISFDRIGGSTDEVSILVNNTPIEDLVGYTVLQVNFSTWQVDPALPAGTVVRLARTTNLDKMVYVFTAGSKFIAKNVDDNFKQIQHSQQEIRDRQDKLEGDATALLLEINDVKLVAEQAALDANEALDKVDSILNTGVVPASMILTSGGGNQQQFNDAQEVINLYGAKTYTMPAGGYPIGGLVRLDNGDIVKSIIPNNTNDPNVDMLGWEYVGQKTVDSIAELLSISHPYTGLRVFVESYHVGLGKGGGWFAYDSSKSAINNGGLVINGWVREYEIANAYMFGLKADGTDEIALLNNAIQHTSRLDLIGGAYKINPLVGLQFKDNFELWFKDGAKIESLATSEGTYELAELRKVNNVRIYNMHLVGDRAIHTGTAGEWGHGLSILGCNNIFIYKPKVTHCWGDGIYIGSDMTTSTWGSKDITVIEPVTDDNSRNGVTIIGGKNIRVQRPTSRRNNRILPMAGIGIEPNRYYEPVTGVKIVDPYTEENGNVGCYVGLRNYQLANSPVFDVTITNHTSINEGINGFLAACNSKGVVHYTNPKIITSGKSAINLEKWECSARLYIDEPYIYNANRLNELSDRIGSAISIWRDSTLATQELGGVIIKQPTIIDDRAVKLMRHAIFVSDGNTSGIGLPKDILILDPVQIDAGVSGRVVGAFKGAITDSRNVLTRQHTDAESSIQGFGYTNFAKKVYSAPNKELFLTLENPVNRVECPDFEVINTAALTMRIIPPTGVTIYPLGTSGKYLQTTQKGARIKLVARSDGWYIENIQGTWTVQV